MTVNNRWFQLCASVVVMVMIANLQYAWTLFVQLLLQGNAWKLSDVQWAFTLFILCQTWVQPLEGWLIDRLGPRRFISLAGVLCGAGWAGLGYATTLPGLYTLYAVAGVGAALVYSASMGSALKWVRERRGLAAGIMAAGFGSGTRAVHPDDRVPDSVPGISRGVRDDRCLPGGRDSGRRAVSAISRGS